MASTITMRSLTLGLVLSTRNVCRMFPSVTKFHSEDKASRFLILRTGIFHHYLLSEFFFLSQHLPNYQLQLKSKTKNKQRENQVAIKQTKLHPTFTSVKYICGEMLQKEQMVNSNILFCSSKPCFKKPNISWRI